MENLEEQISRLKAELVSERARSKALEKERDNLIRLLNGETVSMECKSPSAHAIVTLTEQHEKG